MKHLGKVVAVAMVTLIFSACQKDAKQLASDDTISAQSTESTATDRHGGDNQTAGHVYTLSNQANDNKIIVYRRSAKGRLEFEASYSTGGKGTGAGLGSQGAIVLTHGGDMLLAVNAGSNSISAFKISGNRLNLVSTVQSGGVLPISVTEDHDLVYVVNAGGNGNISGFRIASNGRLSPIQYSSRPLSSNAAGPAQISFVNDGHALVITEKNTNKIITYTINYFGRPDEFHSIASANATPFGFAVRKFGNIIVSEAGGGAAGASTVSSYRVYFNGAISLVKGPVSAGQTAACWVAVTDNEKYAYAANTGSNNVSSFKVNFSGDLNILNATAGATNGSPTDADLSDGSRYLYVLNTMGTHINAYEVAENGNISDVQTIEGLQQGGVGLVAE